MNGTPFSEPDMEAAIDPLSFTGAARSQSTANLFDCECCVAKADAID